ncbi:MAG: cohesin domain-containing protein [Nitrososphaerota archaeon]|nr:cohesin domain-containing protein [Nitrososphaerota archaeon]
MKLKYLLFIVLLLLALICIVVSESEAQTSAIVNITPSTTQLSFAQIGTIIEVQLYVENVQNLFGWNLNLTWNPKVLNLTNIQEGPFLSNAGSTLCTWAPSLSPTSRSQGYINSTGCILLEAHSVNGSGVLATLSFKILSTGVSPISIEGTQLINPSPAGVLQYITTTLNSGTITITSPNNGSDNNLNTSSDNNSNNRPDNSLNSNSNNSPETNSDNNLNSPTEQAYQNPPPPTQSPLQVSVLVILIIIIVVVLVLSVNILIWHKKH